MKQGAFSGALRLIEDAVDLLRDAPSAAWLVYLGGVVPFFALFLFETTDIYESPFASDRLLWISLLLGIAYVWMHACQAAFARHLDVLVSARIEEPAPWLRVLGVQAIVESTKLLAWPVAVILVIPHSLVTMFYQHTLCLPAPTAGDLKTVVREAKRDAGYRQPEAAWLLVLILILRALVWINFLALFLITLLLFHSFTGLENTLTRQPLVLLNPTFMAALCVLAYVALDPVVKAACVLRAFRRRSEKSGLDLQLRLSKLQRVAAASLLAVVFFLAASPLARPAVGEAAVSPPPSSAIRPIDNRRVEQAIREVFRDPNLSWSLPVVVKRKPPSNAFLAFTESAGAKIGEWWDRFVKAWEDLIARLRKLVNGDERDGDAGRQGVKTNARDVWMLISIFGALLAAAVFFALLRSRRFASTITVEARPAEAPVPDLSREDIQADEQPDDEWMRLASEYRRDGNLRFAIRALYLACLSTLATAKLISIARGKSNLDYAREFQRRARRLPAELPDRLRLNVSLFERSWYGSHAVTEEMLDQFEQNLVVLKTQTAGGAS
jgi:Domain of unknown function (DUF4129)